MPPAAAPIAAPFLPPTIAPIAAPAPAPIAVSLAGKPWSAYEWPPEIGALAIERVPVVVSTERASIVIEPFPWFSSP